MKKIRLFPATEALLDFGNGLQPRCWSRGEVVKTFVVLITLNEVKPGEVHCRERAHSTVHEQTEKSDHVVPPIGCHLEHDEPKILEDLHEKRMQGEPHPKLDVGLRSR